MADHKLAEPQTEAPKTVNVTYIPRENGDPHQVKYAGILFRAHVPTPVRVDATVETLQRREKEMEDGAIRTQGIEGRARVIERLKSNPWFLVEGFEQAERRKGKARLPSNPDEYRGYALRWIAGGETAAELQTRWGAEQKLRDDCGCTEADLAQVMPFYWARVEVLGEAA